MTEVHAVPFADLDRRVLYDILRLRAEVFVVEQECAFNDLDGRDTEPDAVHLWIEDEAGIAGYARLVRETDGSTQMGRVVTAPRVRGTGVGATVVRAGLAHAGRPLTINAQSHLTDWYARFGFVVSGTGFLEDGIPHTPMTLKR